MDTSRISQGELIAGIGGLVLFLALFLDWSGPVNAWEAFDLVDILLAIIGLGVAALAAVKMAGNAFAIPGGTTTIALAGFAAFWITLTFLIESEERELGLYLAFIAAAAMTYGGWRALQGPRATPPAAAHTGTTTP